MAKRYSVTCRVPKTQQWAPPVQTDTIDEAFEAAKLFWSEMLHDPEYAFVDVRIQKITTFKPRGPRD